MRARTRLAGGVSLFDDTPEGLRRLILVLYAAIAPPFIGALAFIAAPDHRVSATLALLAISAAGAGWVASRKSPTPNDWIFPVSVVPNLAWGIGYAATHGLGPVFLMASGVSVLLPAMLFGGRVVAGSWLLATLTAFVSLAWHNSLAYGAVSAALFAAFYGPPAWVVYGKVRRRAEARLRSLDRLILNDIELVLLPDGSIVDANDRAVSAYGYSRDELLALNIRDVRRDDPEVAMQNLSRLQADYASVFEAVHYRRDGTAFPVEVSARMFMSAGVLYCHSLIRDITSRRKGQADQRFLAALVSAMHEALMVVDGDLRVRTWSPGAERVFGWTADEMIGQLMFPRLRPEMREEDARRRFELAFATGASGELERVWRKRKDGREVLVSLSVTALRDEHGNPAGVLAVGRDVTAEHEMQEALRRSEERMNLVLAGSHDGFWDYQPASGYTVYSPRFAEILGLAPEDLGTSAKAYLDRIDPDDVAGVARAMDDFMEGRASGIDREYRVRCGDGSLKWVHARGRVVERDAGGRPTRVAGVLTDISVRKQAEAELRDALAHVKTLSGLLPMCAWCKKIRDDAGYWQKLENYLSQHTDVRLSHGMCPECYERFKVENHLA